MGSLASVDRLAQRDQRRVRTAPRTGRVARRERVDAAQRVRGRRTGVDHRDVRVMWHEDHDRTSGQRNRIHSCSIARWKVCPPTDV